MKYQYNLLIRLGLALLAGIFFNIFYVIFYPVTFNLTIHSLKYFYTLAVTDNTIVIGSHILKFIPACTAASAYFLLLLLILLTKDIPLKKSIYMFLLGSLLILAANIIRIDILIYILIKYGSNLFNTLHLFIWKILSSLFVVLIWILLTKKFKIKTIPIYSDYKFLIKNLK